MIVLILILTVFLLVLLFPIKVKIMFSEKLDFTVKFLNFSLLDLRKRPQKNETKTADEASVSTNKFDNPTNTLKTLKTYLDVVLEILKILYKYLKNRVNIKELNFKIAFGLDDAALTGIFSGAVYTIVNGFYAYVLNNFAVSKHSVEIQPDFDNIRFDVSFLLKFNVSLLWLLCLLFYERKAINKLFKIIKKDGVDNG